MEDSIEHFYDGRSVFITGGTGFMGKVLIEKILRSCPGVDKIYVLIRPSREGKSPDDKLKDVFDLPLFEPLKKSHPSEIFNKVIPITGDIKKLGLGISPEDRKTLIDNVSVIFHAAASVRFDDPIHEAIIINTRGTREVVALAKEIKNIAVLVHVSTTYCNCYRKIVEETIYPAPMNWKEAIFMAENCDPVLTNILSKKYLGAFPNSYVFTKNLSESLLKEECKDIPTVIFRPSIVISSVKEPVSGWIDNVNGPVGFMIGIGKGIIRVTFTSKYTRPDYMPVDISIKGMLVAAWNKATEKGPGKKEILIINSSSGYKSIQQWELVEIGMKFSDKYPPIDSLWLPGILFTTDPTCYYVNLIIKQVMPAIVIDWILAITKKKPLHLLKIQRKIYRASMELSYFTAQEWLFINMNFMKILNSIPSQDKEAFDFAFDDIDPCEYLRDGIIGGHKYLLNTDITSLPAAVTRVKRMVYIRNTLRALFWGFVMWYIYSYFASNEE
ncbi:putative fatty acyl-CoA reductase CG5065 [Planococcus citri]|uniref:putative fatty acyl-CoA reductase CG5065 n=1 Tax=Planococcus citri TaxID=170843 RepID=UPI0031F8A395